MRAQDRREFLKKLAKTAAYSAPIVYSFSAPAEVEGLQKGMSSGKGMMGMGMLPMGMGKPLVQQPPPGAAAAPWEQP